MGLILNNATLFGLLFFFGFFIVMAVWVYRPGSKKSYQGDAHIPLSGDEK
jgi:cbb3-type cytochrome oxidase subunit 3